MKLKDLRVVMIRVKNDPVSEGYANYCLQSWKDFCDVELYDAVTPSTLHKQTGILQFNPMSNDIERSCYYSQFNLWRECAEDDKPILVLEHDAWLREPSAIVYNPYIQVQFLGKFAMEAVLYNPEFARKIVKHCGRYRVSGPMTEVYHLIGGFKVHDLHKHNVPHTKFMGDSAPVISVYDPTVGNTVPHYHKGGQNKGKLKVMSEEKIKHFKNISLNI